MAKQSVRPTDSEAEFVCEKYFGLLYKYCFSYLGNSADAEDAVSETMLKFMTKAPEFQSEEHRKAWLLRVSSNICKNMCRFRREKSLSDIEFTAPGERNFEIIESFMNLPQKYRNILYLHYIAGYKAREIAEMLDISEAAAKKRLQYARDAMKSEYEGGCFNEA